MLFNAHSIQRNCNQAALYMSEDLGDLQIYSVYHLQGVARMQFLFRHCREMDTTGKLLLASIRHTQLEFGISTPFFETNFYSYSKIITPTWSTNLWQYMSECNAILHDIEPWIYKPPRQNDFFLMDVVMRSDLPDNYKEICNKVRMNMRLLTASDLVAADSK